MKERIANLEFEYNLKLALWKIILREWEDKPQKILQNNKRLQFKIYKEQLELNNNNDKKLI